MEQVGQSCMKVETGLQMSWWFLNLFQLSVSYWIQKRINKDCFTNSGLNPRRPVAILLWLSVVHKLWRNYWLFFACQLRYDNGKYCVRQTFSHCSVLTHWHIFSKQKPITFLVCFCLLVASKRTKSGPISLYEKSRQRTKKGLLHRSCR